MGDLTIQEMDAVSGGFSFWGITGIESGLKLIAQVNQIGAAGLKAFAAGYAVGTGINHLYEWAMGATIGGDLYDLCHAIFN